MIVFDCRLKFFYFYYYDFVALGISMPSDSCGSCCVNKERWVHTKMNCVWWWGARTLWKKDACIPDGHTKNKKRHTSSELRRTGVIYRGANKTPSQRGGVINLWKLAGNVSPLLLAIFFFIIIPLSHSLSLQHNQTLKPPFFLGPFLLILSLFLFFFLFLQLPIVTRKPHLQQILLGRSPPTT